HVSEMLGGVCTERHVLLGWEPAGLDCEVIDQEEGENEARYCNQAKSAGVQDLVDPRTRLVRSEDPGGYADQKREELGIEHELQRHAQFLADLIGDGAPRLVGLVEVPEVPAHEVRQPVAVLDEERLVEADVVLDVLDLLG